MQGKWITVRAEPREYRARQADPGELIATPRGWEIAQDGDWVMEGDDADRWLVSAERLSRYFEVVGSLVAR